MEGLLRSLIHSSRIAVQSPADYEARSNIMWIATWALNTLVAKGKSTDWMVHMIGQSIGAYTDATHGMTLAAVSLPYYRHIMPYGLAKFKRFAINVWDVRPTGVPCNFTHATTIISSHDGINKDKECYFTRWSSPTHACHRT